MWWRRPRPVPPSRLEVYDDTAKVRTEAPGLALVVEDPTPLAELPDWEREFLARQWVEDHADEETRWLVARLTTEQAGDVLWRLVDARSSQIKALTEEVERLRRDVAKARQETARIRAREATLREHLGHALEVVEAAREWRRTISLVELHTADDQESALIAAVDAHDSRADTEVTG
jgi:hypothetical protein